MGYLGDAGFLCDRPDLIRNRIEATFCISVRFVLKCLTAHSLLFMLQLEAHSSLSQRNSSANFTEDEQLRLCHGLFGKPAACYRVDPSSETQQSM